MRTIFHKRDMRTEEKACRPGITIKSFSIRAWCSHFIRREMNAENGGIFLQYKTSLCNKRSMYAEDGRSQQTPRYKLEDG